MRSILGEGEVGEGEEGWRREGREVRELVSQSSGRVVILLAGGGAKVLPFEEWGIDLRFVVDVDVLDMDVDVLCSRFCFKSLKT